jgi:hypothetical protein
MLNKILNNKLFLIFCFIIVIIVIIIIIFCKCEKFSVSKKIICPTECKKGLLCPPGCFNCKNIKPSPPGPPGPPPPISKHFFTNLVSDLNKNSLIGNSETDYEKLSGIIIIKPGDDVKKKLSFMLEEWKQLTMPDYSKGYPDGDVNTAIQNAIYPYNTNTNSYTGKTNRQSYNKPYTIIFLPDLEKDNTTYIINDPDDGTNLINLFYYSSIYSFQTEKNKVTLLGNIGPNYIPDNGVLCGDPKDGDIIKGRARCGPWSRYVQTGQYTKTNSADNVFFKLIENIDIQIGDKETPHNSLIWNTSQMCPIRRINLYAENNDKYSSIELGGGVGGFLSDSTIENIYTSALGQWMASQENYCFKNVKFNKLGNYRGSADAANIGNINGNSGVNYPFDLKNKTNYILGATSQAYYNTYKQNTLNKNACWTRYTNKDTKPYPGAENLKDGCPGQFNFVFLNCKKQLENKEIDDDNFLTTGAQQLCSITTNNNVKITPGAPFNGAFRSNGPNVIEKDSDNNYNKPYITAEGIIINNNKYGKYTIISNDDDFSTFLKGDQEDGTICIILSNIYNFNNKVYDDINFVIKNNNITLLGLGFVIIKSRNTINGLELKGNNIILSNFIIDCPDITNKKLQNSVLKISGNYCQIYDITIRTVIRCPKLNIDTSKVEPYPYSNTNDACTPGKINKINEDDLKNVIPVGSACMILNTGDNCYMENLWLWRGDHWNWGGFNKDNQTMLDPFNICPFGLIVLGNGSQVVQASIEHFSLSSVLWIGENGKSLAIQGEVAYANFGNIDLIGTGNLTKNFKDLFNPSSSLLDKFSSDTSNINWNYGIWEDYEKTENFNSLDDDSNVILQEIPQEIKNKITKNIFINNTGYYYTILAKEHYCNGAGVYSLFGIGNSNKYAFYINPDDYNKITVKNAYLSGWASYGGNNNTVFNGISNVDNTSITLGDGYYICDIKNKSFIEIGKNQVDDNHKGNAVNIPIATSSSQIKNYGF